MLLQVICKWRWVSTHPQQSGSLLNVFRAYAEKIRQRSSQGGRLRTLIQSPPAAAGHPSLRPPPYLAAPPSAPLTAPPDPAAVPLARTLARPARLVSANAPHVPVPVAVPLARTLVRTVSTSSNVAKPGRRSYNIGVFRGLKAEQHQMLLPEGTEGGGVRQTGVYHSRLLL